LSTNAAEDERPERERVEAREGDVAGADLQRHEEVEERGGQRHDPEEDHRGAVHGEQLVVHARRDEVVVRAGPAGRGSRRASTPPMRKYSIAKAPYMMPIFLWSTVVSQSVQPVARSGR
jgi:hypothetical protein